MHMTVVVITVMITGQPPNHIRSDTLPAYFVWLDSPPSCRTTTADLNLRLIF